MKSFLRNSSKDAARLVMLTGREFATFVQIAGALKKEGFEKAGQSGSHVKFYKKNNIVTVPDHGNKDIAKGTLAAIIRQAEVAGVCREMLKRNIGMGGR